MNLAYHLGNVSLEPQVSDSPEHKLLFKYKVLEDEVQAEAVVLSNCIFLWTGRQRITETLFFGKDNMTLQISGDPTPNNTVFLQQITAKLAKLFTGKQVSRCVWVILIDRFTFQLTLEKVIPV